MGFIIFSQIRQKKNYQILTNENQPFQEVINFRMKKILFFYASVLDNRVVLHYTKHSCKYLCIWYCKIFFFWWWFGLQRIEEFGWHQVRRRKVSGQIIPAIRQSVLWCHFISTTACNKWQALLLPLKLLRIYDKLFAIYYAFEPP